MRNILLFNKLTIATRLLILVNRTLKISWLLASFPLCSEI